MTDTADAELDALSRDILRRNDRGGYTVPNELVYPFQWNWDSAFVAMGQAVDDVDRAWRELETLFLGQWPDGMVPSIVFHQPHPGYYPGPDAWGTRHDPPTTGISQPPVAATAARVILERDGSEASRRRARDLLPRLFASHRWWHEVRDPAGSGLVVVTHPWETGRDNAPDWDAPLMGVVPRVDVAGLRKDKTHVNASERPTDDFYNRVMTLVEEAKALAWDGPAVARSLSLRVCDLGVQSILVRADRDLLALARSLGFSDEAAALEGWIARSTAAFARLRHADGSYRSLDLVTGRLAETVTVGSFLPLYARVTDAASAATLAGLAEHWLSQTRVALASTDPEASVFDPHRYWRGPVWPVVNRLLADGFAGMGRPDLARRLWADTRAVIRRSGLREYFDPRDGTGLGGKDFSWTAATWLAWREDNPELTPA